MYIIIYMVFKYQVYFLKVVQLGALWTNLHKFFFSDFLKMVNFCEVTKQKISTYSITAATIAECWIEILHFLQNAHLFLKIELQYCLMLIFYENFISYVVGREVARLSHWKINKQTKKTQASSLAVYITLVPSPHDSLWRRALLCATCEPTLIEWIKRNFRIGVVALGRHGAYSRSTNPLVLLLISKSPISWSNWPQFWHDISWHRHIG